MHSCFVLYLILVAIPGADGAVSPPPPPPRPSQPLVYNSSQGYTFQELQPQPQQHSLPQPNPQSLPKLQPQPQPQSQPQPQPQSTGRRKALLIGINYFGQRGQLRGCINDAHNMASCLQTFGYRMEDMVILTDDQQNHMSQPTKSNILQAVYWLVRNARSDDALFFQYSGMNVYFCFILYVFMSW